MGSNGSAPAPRTVAAVAVIACVAVACRHRGDEPRPGPSPADQRIERCVTRLSQAVASDLRSGTNAEGLALQRESGPTGREYRTYSAVFMNESFQRAKARGHDEALAAALPVIRGGCAAGSP